MLETGIAVRSERGENAYVVRVMGGVDLASARVIEPVIRRAGRRPERLLVIDLSTVTFFGAVGVSLMVNAACRAHLTGTALRLVATRRIVLRPMEIAGVIESFVIHDSVDTALLTRPVRTARRTSGHEPAAAPVGLVAIASQREAAEQQVLPAARPFAGIAEAYQGCVVTILRATRFGWLTQAEATLLLDRAWALSTALATRR